MQSAGLLRLQRSLALQPAVQDLARGGLRNDQVGEETLPSVILAPGGAFD